MNKKVAAILAVVSKNRVVAFCIVLLAISYAVTVSQSAVKDEETTVLKSEISQLQDCLSGNVSQASTLTAEITILNREIVELNSIIAQENAENDKLKRQISELTDLLDKIEDELDGIVRTETICLLVDRLREIPVLPIDVP